MKLTCFVTFLLCIVCSFSFGQSSKPKGIIKAIHSDKTTELRNMKIVVAGEKSQRIENREIPNGIATRDTVFKSSYKSALAPVVQRSQGSMKGGILLVNIDGIGDLGTFPSDANGDVGLNHYIQTVNASVAVWDKSGNLLYGPVALSTLWEGFEGPWEGIDDNDPVVVYDELADRWLISHLRFPENPTGPYYQLIAVSATSDPLGAWNRYAYRFDDFNDYPKFGVWPDGYYSTYNMMAISSDSTSTKLGAAIVVFDRESMLKGEEDAQGVIFENEQLLTLLPADFDGPPPAENTPFPILAATIKAVPEIYEISMNWDDPFSSNMQFKKAIDWGSFTLRFEDNGIPQPGHDFLLRPVGDHLMYRLQYRNFGDYEVLLTNVSEDVNGTVGVRWLELRRQNEEWNLYQQGTFCPDSLHRWMGSIAMNGKGEIALGYSVGGKNKWASVRFTGQSPNYDHGIMNFAEVETVTGIKNAPRSNRWGDYSCMSVDPVNDETFWYTSQYSGLPAWKTNIVSFNLGELSALIVDAGENVSICSTSRYDIYPTVSNEKSVLWTTTGDGQFKMASKAETQYKPGRGDIKNGQVSLILTAYGWVADSFSQDTLFLTIENCTGIQQIELEDQITVMPNPSNGVFTFALKNLVSQHLKIELADFQGRVIFTQKLDNLNGNYSNQLDLEHYPTGTYFLRIFDKENVVVRKLIKQ